MSSVLVSKTKSLPKYYTGMLYATMNFINTYVTDNTQQQELYKKLPLFDVSVDEQMLYFDNHCDIPKVHKTMYLQLKSKHDESSKPVENDDSGKLNSSKSGRKIVPRKGSSSTGKKLKVKLTIPIDETELRETLSLSITEEIKPATIVMYLYKIDKTRYWTPDEDLLNGPLYSSIIDSDGDPNHSSIVVGQLIHGKPVFNV